MLYVNVKRYFIKRTRNMPCCLALSVFTLSFLRMLFNTKSNFLFLLYASLINVPYDDCKIKTPVINVSKCVNFVYIWLVFMRVHLHFHVLAKSAGVVVFHCYFN